MSPEVTARSADPTALLPTLLPTPLPALLPTQGPAQPHTDALDRLVVASGQGDPHAYDRLYTALFARVHALATRIVRDADLAREVAQEVLSEVWRTSATYDPARGSALGWAMTITHHRAVDRVRHEEALRRRDETYVARSRTIPFDETAVAGAARIEGTAVRAAVAALTPLQRQAIELAYFGGLSHAQAARHLEVPLGTVKSRIRDGLVRLRDHLPTLAPEAA